jgi:hypothetical protein
MSKAHLTALATALALGAFAPRLAAQDTSSAGGARPDTSGYTGAGGVDTSARPGRVGAMDTAGAAAGVTDSAGGAAADTASLRKAGDSAEYAPRSGAATSSAVPMGAGDTSGIPGRRADSIKTGGGATLPRSGADSSWSADSAAAAKSSP